MTIPRRRRFLSAVAGLMAGSSLRARQITQPANSEPVVLPPYARSQNYRSLKQSSYDRTGGNHDFWEMAAGQTLEVFQSDGPGIISHIWFTIAPKSQHHLKELVLRIFWDGNSKPSVETPIGDFFGLNLGEYFLYQSALTNCSSVKAMNSYFAMPFRRSARITVTNEGNQQVNALYSNIDYKLTPTLPADALYFHAQYRQATPNQARNQATSGSDKNLYGRGNYTFFETRGSGHAMGVTLGVLQNADGWFGEGDEMIFVDNDSKPLINGTGTEDFFCGAWDFGGRNGAVPFANLYNGAPYIALAEITGGRYCMYRWYVDNPVTFQQSMKFTIEHGHANDRADNFFSVGYWYQTEPFTDFPPLPPVTDRVPRLHLS